MSKVCCKPGTMWAILAACSSHGMLSSHVWDDRSCSPLGKFMMSGVVATRLLMTGAPGMVKCAVASMSTRGCTHKISKKEMLEK